MRTKKKENSPSTTFRSKSGAGFTLIETLVVAAIGIVLAAALFIGFSNQNVNQDLDLTVSSLASFLRDAQESSRGQEASTSWGVYFDNPVSGDDYYALFNGSTFGSADSTVTLPTTVEFSDPAGGANKEVVFAKLTGLPPASISVTLRLVDDLSATRTVTVNANGSVSY